MNFIRRFSKISPNVRNLIFAEAFIQLTNSAFFLLINFLFLDAGFVDEEIANFYGSRFFAVMLLAFPLGLFIKGKAIKPLFQLSAIFTPALALINIFCIESQNEFYIHLSLIGWGISFTLMRVCILPYILLNTDKKYHSEAISASFMTWSLAMVVVGFFTFVFNQIDENIFSVRNVLIGCALLGFASNGFLLRMKNKEVVSEKIPLFGKGKSYDWSKIALATTPTFIIAVGAGLTIPFVNLFFNSVHNVDADQYALMGSATYVLVVIGLALVPGIKRRFGYSIAITLIQSMSVMALIGMATTQFYAELAFAAPLAIGFFIIRQPLMNVAGPMTSELAVYFVGQRNQELISAINGSIWAGSWWVSAKIFELLREQHLDYVFIFLITAGIYILGVVWYHFLIIAYRRDKRKRAAANQSS